jgi:hypothetical protein
MKTREEFDKMGAKKTIQRINETKSWFFEKIHKIDKFLAKLTKRKREKTQSNKIQDEKGDIKTPMTFRGS